MVPKYQTELFRKGSFPVVVAEWLRRWTRNPLGSPRAGSNPANNDTPFRPVDVNLRSFLQTDTAGLRQMRISASERLRQAMVV